MRLFKRKMKVKVKVKVNWERWHLSYNKTPSDFPSQVFEVRSVFLPRSFSHAGPTDGLERSGKHPER